MFGEGHVWEIALLLLIALLVFGPGKLPDVGAALGRGIREFRDASAGTLDAAAAPERMQLPPARPEQEPELWQVRPITDEEPVPAAVPSDMR